MPTRGNPGQGDGSQDEGFTLIELLVVIIIIGILAAIAIPVFFNQRAKAFDAAMKSDIHTLAQFEEAYLVDADVYGTFVQLTAKNFDVQPSRDVTVVLTTDDATGYCLIASHPGSTDSWVYDSQAGGLQDKGIVACPVTAGAAGGTVTG